MHVVAVVGCLSQKAVGHYYMCWSDEFRLSTKGKEDTYSGIAFCKASNSQPSSQNKKQFQVRTKEPLYNIKTTPRTYT